MTRSHEKEDAELRNAACFLLFVCLCVVVALLTTTFPNHRRNHKLVTRSAQLKVEKTTLRKANKRLRHEIEALETDPFYIEAVARNKYRLIRPGETLIEPAAGPDGE